MPWPREISVLKQLWSSAHGILDKAFDLGKYVTNPSSSGAAPKAANPVTPKPKLRAPTPTTDSGWVVVFGEFPGMKWVLWIHFFYMTMTAVIFQTCWTVDRLASTIQCLNIII